MRLPSLLNRDFPLYKRDLSIKDLQVYWYHPDFTQSRYPPGQEISRACTLICLLVAQRVCHSKLIIWNVEDFSQLEVFIAESIVEGNETHAWIIQHRLVPDPYLNTDEALKFGGNRMKTLKEWKFQVFRENIQINLCHNIQAFLREWYQKPKAESLIMLLITCGRTVLFLFQNKTKKVTFFDSHGHVTPRHPHRGLVVAQAKLVNLQILCDWYVQNILYGCFNVQALQYELAFLYNLQSGCCNNDKILCDCGCSKC